MLRFLHFCDNQKVPEKTYDNYDQRKIKTIFNKLNDSTLHLTDHLNVLQLMKLLCYSNTKSFSNSIYQRNTKGLGSKFTNFECAYTQRQATCEFFHYSYHTTVTGYTAKFRKCGAQINEIFIKSSASF